jgi:hypothetical protein
MVQLLVRHGAEVNGARWPVLFCLARDRGADDIIEFLRGEALPHAEPDCTRVTRPL